MDGSWQTMCFGTSQLETHQGVMVVYSSLTGSRIRTPVLILLTIPSIAHTQPPNLDSPPFALPLPLASSTPLLPPAPPTVRVAFCTPQSGRLRPSLRCDQASADRRSLGLRSLGLRSLGLRLGRLGFGLGTWAHGKLPEKASGEASNGCSQMFADVGHMNMFLMNFGTCNCNVGWDTLG